MTGPAHTPKHSEQSGASSDHFHLGGQAVLEGVMLRGKRNWVLSVRAPDDTIIVQARKLNSLLERSPIARLPLIRGFIALIESLTLGVRAISISAQQAAGEQEEELSAREIAVAIAISILLAVVLFIAVPAAFARALYELFESPLLINLLEGLVKIAIFTGYIWAISHIKDIARVFEYHGAEHKVIHSHEAGETVSVETATKHTTLHVRCGTSFLLLVLVLSIFIFSFLGRPPLLERVLYHIAIIPLIAGMAYEVIKAAGSRPSRIIRAVVAPGLALQRLTTREPSPSQIEVAIVALEKLLKVENGEHPSVAIDGDLLEEERIAPASA